MKTITPWLALPTLIAALGLQAQPSTQPGIPGVITAGAQVQLIRDGYQGLEGPVGTTDGGLLFNDIPTSQTFKLSRDGSIALWRDSTGRANGQFLMANGRLIVAESGRQRVVALSPTRQVSVLASQLDGSPLRAPNDLVPDRKGGIYVTDPAVRPDPARPPKESGNLLYVGPSGRVVLLDSVIRRPNGLP
jgi:gluconolactonase